MSKKTPIEIMRHALNNLEQQIKSINPNSPVEKEILAGHIESIQYLKEEIEKLNVEEKDMVFVALLIRFTGQLVGEIERLYETKEDYHTRLTDQLASNITIQGELNRLKNQVN